jgi:hypothetical protein
MRATSQSGRRVVVGDRLFAKKQQSHPQASRTQIRSTRKFTSGCAVRQAQLAQQRVVARIAVDRGEGPVHFQHPSPCVVLAISAFKPIHGFGHVAAHRVDLSDLERPVGGIVRD